MSPYCSPHNAGQAGGAGGRWAADKRKSNRSQLIFLCLPRLDDGVWRGPWKRKEKDEKRGRKKVGWEVSDGAVWFEGTEQLIRVQNAPSLISGRFTH